MKAHQILGVELDQLRAEGESFEYSKKVFDAYQAKLAKANEIRDYERRTAEQKKLSEAYQALSTPGKRKTYLESIKDIQKDDQVTQTHVSADLGNGLSVPYSGSMKSDKLISQYQNYTQGLIAALDVNDPNYAKDKERLEKNIKDANVKSETHKSYENFTKSSYYQTLSKEEKAGFNKDHFPKQTNTVVLRFESINEMLKFFIKDCKDIEGAKKLFNDVKAKYPDVTKQVDKELLQTLKEQKQSKVVAQEEQASRSPGPSRKI